MALTLVTPFLAPFFTFYPSFLCSVLSTLFPLTSVEHYVNIGCCLLGSEGLKVLLYSKEPDHATYVPNVLVPTTHAIVDYCERGAVIKRSLNWQICLNEEEGGIFANHEKCEKLGHHLYINFRWFVPKYTKIWGCNYPLFGCHKFIFFLRFPLKALVSKLCHCWISITWCPSCGLTSRFKADQRSTKKHFSSRESFEEQTNWNNRFQIRIVNYNHLKAYASVVNVRNKYFTAKFPYCFDISNNEPFT